jgi:hypothetical protein
MKRILVLLGLFSVAPLVLADDAWYGTWVERSAKPMTMTVEKAGSGAKFTYQMPPGFTPNMVMTFETQFDGQWVPVMVDGKPSAETMMVKRIDDRHTSGAWKMQGTPAGTSKSELSADGKVIKVDTDTMAAGPDAAAGKITQYWDKKS